MENKKTLFDFISKIQAIWVIVGITILMFIVINILSVIIIALIPNFNNDQPDKFSEIKSNCYNNANWLDQYLLDLAASSSLNWKSYVYWQRKPFKSKTINIDEKGLRKTWHKTNLATRDKNKIIKIFMFGGSTLWGKWARDDHTIPSEVSKLLYQSGYSNFHITNFGETGYVSTQEVILLIRELQKGNIPDIVVFYDGINDTFAAIQNQEAGIPHNEVNRKTAFNIERNNSALFNRFYKLKLDSLPVYKLIKFLKFKLTKQMKQSKYSFDKKLPEETINVYITNINITESIAKTYGFKTLFYWQPIIFTKKNLSQFEQEKLKESKPFKEFYSSVYNYINKSKYLTSKNNFHNLSDLFKNDKKTYFIDDCHITEKGNNLIAKKIAQNIIEIINKDISQKNK